MKLIDFNDLLWIVGHNFCCVANVPFLDVFHSFTMINCKENLIVRVQYADVLKKLYGEANVRSK